MHFIPAGVVGVALPVACVAAPARDARAPFVHIARAHCACQQARGAVSEPSSGSMVEALATSRSAYALARLLARALHHWRGGRSPRWAVGGVPLPLEITLRARPMFFNPKNSGTPMVTIRAYLNIFQRFLQR